MCFDVLVTATKPQHLTKLQPLQLNIEEEEQWSLTLGVKTPKWCPKMSLKSGDKMIALI